MKNNRPKSKFRKRGVFALTMLLIVALVIPQAAAATEGLNTQTEENTVIEAAETLTPDPEKDEENPGGGGQR